MVREEGASRGYDVRYENRDQPPGYNSRRKQPSSHSFEQERGGYPDEQRRTSPPTARRGVSESESTSYKHADMEKQTIILEKAAPDQGFGIAVSGGLDNPHYETGDTSIIVSDVVEGSPADGLLRVNDVILSVNSTNVEGVEHSVAVEALKHSGYSVKLIILRKRPSTTTSSPSSVEIAPEQALVPSGPSNGTGKEPRNVVLSKLPSESYGLSLGTILFVKDLDYRGPAGRDGRLEPGDVILKINNKRVDDLSRPDAVTIMRNAPERLDLVVLKNKDVPPSMPSRVAHESVSMSKSHMVESSNGMNGQDLIAFKQGAQDQVWNNTLRSTTTYSISSAGKRSDTEKDIDVRRDKKFHGEPHLVSFHRTGNSLGIQVAGGNAVGIFAAAIKDGSPAQVAGLRVGDQLLLANEIEFKDITREEAVLILLSLPEEVSLLVQFKKSVYDKSKEEPGDSFYVKAQFHYASSDEDELSFRRGEVFHVLDTMNGGTIGSWRAQRVLQSGAETEVGIIPNKCRAEQLAITQDLEAKKSTNPKQKSGGTLKRKDTKSTTPKKKQYQAADQLDETSFQLDEKYPAYERVVRRNAGFVRPVVLLGPIADICRDKLMMEYPEKFTSPATFGRYDAKQQSGIKLSGVKDNIASGKHSLLDVTPDGVEMLNFVGLEPIVIFLQPSSKQLIKDLRHDLTSKTHSARFVKKLYDQADYLSFEFPYLFTAVIPLERNNRWYTECVDVIKRQQDDAVWMPEHMNQHNDDELVLQMPRVSVSYDNDPLSHLDSTGDFDRSETVPHGEEEIVVAAATVHESEEAPAVPAYSVTHRADDEHAPGDNDQRELERRQEEDDREYQRRQEEERGYQRRQEEEWELQRRQEEEREFQRREAEEQQERNYQRRQQDEYERQLEQREYERRQYEENRRGYDDESRHRDERKPYIPPGIKVLPGSVPAVVTLKRTDAGAPKSPRDEQFQDEGLQTIHLRHVERDADGEKFDERIGVKVSDVFDIGKDIETNTQEYRVDGRRMESDRRHKSDSDEGEAEFTRQRQQQSYQPAAQGYPQSSEDYESLVVVETRNTQEAENRAGPIEEDLQRTTVKPVEAANVDLDDMFSSRQVNTGRMQTTVSTTTTSRTSYQVGNQSRNTVIDTRSGRKVENPVFSTSYPTKARAQIVNVDSDKGFSERRRDEPEIKMEFESRVSSEPASYDRRPPVARYDDDPMPDRRPPPPDDDHPPPRPKAYSSMYPRPFGTQSSTSYNEFRRTAPDYPPSDRRPYNDDYQEPMPEDEARSYGSTAYRNPATDYDDPNHDATRSYSEI